MAAEDNDGTAMGEFFRLDDTTQGLARELSPGVNARIFTGDNSMLSIVSFAPNSAGSVHSHPEEQWGVLLEGDGVREQGGVRVPVRAGDFWRTPGGVLHGFTAGPAGATIMDIFSPPRQAYSKKGAGFASEG